jgi:hypothetical protein
VLHVSHTGCFSGRRLAGRGREQQSSHHVSANPIFSSGAWRTNTLRGLFPRADVDDPITNREPMRWSRTAVFVVVGSCTASMDPWMIDGWCQSSRAACSDQRMPAAISDRFSSRLQGPGLDYFSDQWGVPWTANALWVVDRRGPAGRRRPQGAARNLASTSTGPRTAKRILEQTTATNRVNSETTAIHWLIHSISPSSGFSAGSPATRSLLHLCAISTSFI